VKRREFITLLGGAGAAASPLAAWAQQAKTVGFIGANNAAEQKARTDTFDRRLRDLGWGDGRNLTIEHRWAEGRSQLAADIAGDFVRRKVDVIVVVGTAAALAAQQATSVIPIMFVAASDPIGTRLVASLARPGGNVTGLSQQATDTAGKRIEQLREILPSLRRLAIPVNAGNPAVTLEITEAEAAARTLGLETITAEILTTEDIAPAIERLAAQADALFVPSDPFFFSNRTRINTIALSARLPTTYGTREWVEAGALMSYGPSLPDLFRRAAEYVDKMLRGTKPGDLPVEQPTKFEFVINLTTARALGLDVPATLLARADEVIE
jgi:putative ABC transport system substrate-binding protein